MYKNVQLFSGGYGDFEHKILEPAPQGMGAPQAKENTSRYTAGVPMKSHGSMVSEIDQLVRFGELTELCVSAFLPPDLTSVEVSDTHKNLKNKRNVTMS